MNKQELIQYLDVYLKISEFKDSSKNGLQVDTEKTEIKKIGYAVDASTYIFDKAISENVDMVLSHHGLYWGYEETMTGVWFERATQLIKNDIWLYAAHLPLDVHEEVWNNIWLIKAFVRIFWLREEDYQIESFADHKWKNIWFWVKFKNKLHISNLVIPYAETMWLIKRLFNFGNIQYFTSFAVVSWSAAKHFKDAKEAWYEVFLTGEANHAQMVMLKEYKQTVLIGWHYETEKIGPKLLAYHLRNKFGIEIVFLDEKY